MTDVFNLLCLVGTMLQPVLATDRDSEINLHSNTWMWRLQHRLWNCNMCNNRQVTSNIQHVSNFKFWSIVSLHVLTAFLTYLLTSWNRVLQANRFSSSQEIPRCLWNMKVPYCIHKCPPPLPLLCPLDPPCCAQKGKGGVCNTKQASVWKTLPSERVYLEGW